MSWGVGNDTEQAKISGKQLASITAEATKNVNRPVTIDKYQLPSTNATDDHQLLSTRHQSPVNECHPPTHLTTIASECYQRKTILSA